MLWRKKRELDNQKLELLVGEFDSGMANLKLLNTNIQKDGILQTILEEAQINDIALSRAEERLEGYSDDSTDVASILLVDRHMNILNTVYRDSVFGDMIIKDESIIDAVESYYQILLPVSYYPINEQSPEDKVITFVTQYLNQQTYDHIGSLIYSIKIKALIGNMQTYYRDAFDYTMILDEQGEIIYMMTSEDSESILLESIPNVDQYMESLYEISGVEYIVSSKTFNSYPSWKIVGLNETSKYNKEITNLIIIVIILGLIALILAATISYIVSRRITVPIRELTYEMLKFNSDESPKPLEVKTKDELSDLVKGYNKMIEDIEALIGEIYAKEGEKKALEVKALENKLDFLQSQINPHFIHNTMNALSYLATKYKAEDMKELIMSFNTLLRVSMSDGEDFITVKEEIGFIRSYCNIQYYRYGEILDLAINVDDSLHLCKIPKLILQPLVENAIYHGIAPKGEKCKLIININKSGEGIQMEVIDEGVGIDNDTLEMILEPGQEKHKGFNRIALSNVNDRLNLYYGDECKLNISSVYGLGTKVSFILPENY